VHAIDLLPTVLDAVGIDAPAEIGGVTQSPVDGVSFASTFGDAHAPAGRETQYYEMLGCRAIYHRGWKAVVYKAIADSSIPFDDDPWELYDLDADPAECHDLAAERPDMLRELVERWWIEAARNNVLPLDNTPFGFLFGEERPGHAPRDRYTYYPSGGPVTEEAAVNLRNRSHTIAAAVSIPAAGAEGILLAQGSVLGGYALFVRDGRLHYVHNLVGLETHSVSSTVDVPVGDHVLAFRFAKTGEHSGTGTLLIDRDPVGEVEIPRFTPTRFSITGEGLCCGFDTGMPVVDEYRPPFRFTGKLHRVVVDVSGEPFVDPRAEAELSVRAQ
jgi:arylsulfatase